MQDSKEWLEKFTESFKEHFILSQWTIVIAIAIIVFIILVLLTYYQWLQPTLAQRTKVLALFNKFADANNLTNEERTYLWKIAKNFGLQNPTILFVKRSLYESAKEYIPFDLEKYDALKRKLYEPY